MATVKELSKELKIINDELSDIRAEMKEVKTDINWIKKIQWFGVVTSVSTLVMIIKMLIGG